MTGRQPKKDLLWLRQISNFMASRVILTANRYRLFDLLDGKGLTASQAARVRSLDARATEILLDSLAAVGLLKKKAGTYRNDPVTSRYLVTGKPHYQGDIFSHYSTLWDNWSGLDAVVKTGKPHRKTHDHGSFIRGMHNLAGLKVKKIVDSIDLKGVSSLLDLGGGPGTYAITFARKGISTTLMDFPETVKIARQYVSASSVKDRVKFRAGDFTRDEIGTGYDLVFVSQILHAYDAKTCISMLRKCHKALNPGGRVVVQEFYLDDSRIDPVFSALFAINMLVHTEGGNTYTPREMTDWLAKAGFRSISTRRVEDSVLISGSKTR